MAKMADLDAQGVTDLHSYLIGRSNFAEELTYKLRSEIKIASVNNDISTIELLSAVISIASLEQYPAKA